MAQVKEGVNGIVKGKVGNVVFYTMYGKNIVRSLPDTRNKRKEPSLKQKTQRQRMALVQEFLIPFKELIKLTFAPVSKNNAPYHIAKSFNLLHAINGTEYPDQQLDWNKVYLSAGNCVLPQNVVMQKEAEGVHFSWLDNSGDSRDTFFAIAFDADSHRVEYRFSGVQRYFNEYTWNLNYTNRNLHFWIGFRSSDETNISNSLYLGKL